MDYLENRTFDEIALGDSATIERTLTHEDIELFAVMSGDVNPAHTEFTYYMSQVGEVVDTGPYPTHEINRHARFLSAVAGTEIVAQSPRLAWKRSRDPIAQGRPYAVLNPGSNEFGRRWPLGHYVDLSARLANQGLRVVFIGKGDEKAAGTAIADAADGDTILDWTGKTTLPDILDLMKGAALVVSNDTILLINPC